MPSASREPNLLHRDPDETGHQRSSGAGPSERRVLPPSETRAPQAHRGRDLRHRERGKRLSFGRLLLMRDLKARDGGLCNEEIICAWIVSAGTVACCHYRLATFVDAINRAKTRTSAAGRSRTSQRVESSPADLQNWVCPEYSSFGDCQGLRKQQNSFPNKPFSATDNSGNGEWQCFFAKP